MIKQDFLELEFMSKAMQFDLEKGELNYDDEAVQYFLPVVLHFTNFDWLKIVAENTLTEEDEKIVRNFLDMVKALIEVNAEHLTKEVEGKINRLFGE